MRRFGYYWKEGLRNIFKHGFMSIAAIAIMVACLILTGTVTLIAYNIDLSIVDLSREIGEDVFSSAICLYHRLCFLCIVWVQL